MNNELIIEYGTEELPTGFLNYLEKNLYTVTENILNDLDVPYGKLETFFTPRRILILVSDAGDKQKDKLLEKQGPPAKIFYKENSNELSPVGEKFLKNNNLTLDDVKKVSTKKGEYIFVSKKIPGKPVSEIVPDLTVKIITSLHLPKSMVWNESEFNFIRPIRRITAVFHGNLINVNLAGIDSVDFSIGHSVISPEKISVTNIDELKSALEKNYVMFDFKNRKNKIKQEIDTALKNKGNNYFIKENSELIDINANMVEYPFVQICEFKDEFKNLPEDLISTAIIHHQKAFPVYNNDGITKFFIVVLNNKPNENTKKGNERVVNARLNDAKFFFEEDRKKGKLENFIDGLNDILFLKSLGSMNEKVDRIKKISRYIADKINLNEKVVSNIERTAVLCKADLTTNVVYEFPELQGRAGYIYALLDGEDKDVALGIDEHYKPRNADDTLPASVTGRIVGIADKIDTISGCFSIGLIPTGSADPYQLRRFALAIINILIENKIYLNIYDLIKYSLKNYNVENNEITDSIIEFLKNRYKTILIEKGFRADEIDSILNTEFNDIFDSYLRISSLHKFRKSEEFAALLAALKRMSNILKGVNEFVDFNKELIKENAEKELYEHHLKNQEKFEKYYFDKDYENCMEVLSGYKDLVDKFFDDVLVMDKDEAIKNNRLTLLNMIVSTFKKLIDFSRIQNKKE